MKRPINTVLLGFVLLLVFALVPSRAHALDSSQLEGQLCNLLTERKSGISSKLDEQLAKYEAAKQDRMQDRTARRTELDKTIADARKNADQARAEAQARMEQNFSDEKSQPAVEAYKAAVESAITARRTAFDAARSTFRQSTDNLLSSYSGGLESQISNLKTTVDQAFKTAGSGCGKRGQNITATREAFIATLKDARLNYNDYRRNRQDTAAQIKGFAQTRNDAYKSATQTFQQAMQQARNDYEAAQSANGQ